MFFPLLSVFVVAQILKMNGIFFKLVTMQKIFGSKLTYDRSLSNIGTKLRVSLSFHFSASACSNPENRAKMSVILWSIWKSRNTKLWDNVETHPAVAFSTSMQYFSEWKHAELSSQAHTSPLYSTSGNNTTITWIPPQQNHLKCNLDASIFQKLNSFGIGLCLRDSNGSFIKAKTISVSGVPLPKVVEVWALKQAIFWTKQLNLRAWL